MSVVHVSSSVRRTFFCFLKLTPPKNKRGTQKFGVWFKMFHLVQIPISMFRVRFLWFTTTNPRTISSKLTSRTPWWCFNLHVFLLFRTLSPSNCWHQFCWGKTLGLGVFCFGSLDPLGIHGKWSIRSRSSMTSGKIPGFKKLEKKIRRGSAGFWEKRVCKGWFCKRLL